VVVAETGEGQYSNAIAVGNHLLRADEPVKNGGDDTGPDPYGLLMASLGS
jgi:putative redox protein